MKHTDCGKGVPKRASCADGRLKVFNELVEPAEPFLDDGNDSCSYDSDCSEVFEACKLPLILEELESKEARCLPILLAGDEFRLSSNVDEFMLESELDLVRESSNFTDILDALPFLIFLIREIIFFVV